MKLIENREIYTEVVENGILRARKLVWIATANLKDLHIKSGQKYVSILDRFVSMAGSGVSIRVIHAAEPSGPFKNSFDRHRELIRGDVEFLLCPRVHFKIVVIDGVMAYTGSANFTGAGLGGKSKDRRNLEIGIVFNEKEHVTRLMEIFDQVWRGEHCPSCRRRNLCPDPIN
ncbi:MAG TPA: phospholipase D family protein [Thermodesulfobacteriota bacterium]|nr:phospholipase D family protein [Thermodesulfobacteriota bacterium]